MPVMTNCSLYILRRATSHSHVLLRQHFPRTSTTSQLLRSRRTMATVKESIPHIIRTADDPRQQGVWTARISEIEQVNSKIRLLKLSLPRDGVRTMCFSSGFPFVAEQASIDDGDLLL